MPVTSAEFGLQDFKFPADAALFFELDDFAFAALSVYEDGIARVFVVPDRETSFVVPDR